MITFMTSAKFAVGERVHISDPDWPNFWANGVSGTVRQPPTSVVELGEGWIGHARMVDTTTGKRPFYWIELDEPRLDADGDGPYHAAEIAESSLRALRSTARDA
jgi:hypothetical protein